MSTDEVPEGKADVTWRSCRSSSLEGGEGDAFVVQHARFSESASARLSTLFAWEPNGIDVYRNTGERVLEDVMMEARILDL